MGKRVFTDESLNALVNEIKEGFAKIPTVYTAAQCTTFTSDSGTCTPLAVKKATTMFAVPKVTSTNKAITRFNGTAGEVQNSKIIIEDVTNTRDTSKQAQVIAIPAEGGKKMVYGYCTDQIDGTSFIGGIFDSSATEYPYSQGLAIGGTSGNLLWKGSKVATADDLATKAGTSVATTSANGLMSSTDKSKLDGLSNYTLPVAGTALGGVKSGTDITIDSSGNVSVNDNSHNHNASNITSGTLAVARGGTGVTANPSMLTNLGSTTAASVFAASPRPGVTGTLPIANGGTGATTATNALTNLGAMSASAVIPVSQGGTGATDKNTAKINLGITISTSDPSSSVGANGDIWLVVE